MENLLENFGFENFLPGQEEVVREIVYGTNENVIVNMKSLGGKTSAFQLAGFAKGSGLALVICPNLALIEQQVNYLNGLNLQAVSITGLVVAPERYELSDELRNGGTDIRFFYVTPEIIEYGGRVAELVRELCERGDFSFVVIDDGLKLDGFRQNAEYLRALRERNRELKWIVMTTSSEAEINEIQQAFGVDDAMVIRGASLDRADIFLGVRVVNVTRENFAGSFIRDVREIMGVGDAAKTGLIYTRTLTDANYLTNVLRENGIEARAFGGNGEVLDNFNDWLAGIFPVLVASSESLRYGIVKTPLTFVFHFNPPAGLKQYYQESGRANNPNGQPVTRIYVRSDYPDASAYAETHPLFQMHGYLHNWKCRHQYLARVCFGEDIRPCTSFCDNCVA